MRPDTRTWWMLVAMVLSTLLVLAAQQTTALLIEGQQGRAPVVQVPGKNYVEVDELARVTGALRFLGNQIILTLPSSGDTSSPAVQSPPAPPVGYSRPFVNAG